MESDDLDPRFDLVVVGGGSAGSAAAVVSPHPTRHTPPCGV